MNTQSQPLITQAQKDLQDWQEATKALAAWKEREMELRKRVVAAYFPDQAKEALPEGTQNFELGNGYKLKTVFKVNYNLGNADDVDAALAKIEAMGAEGKFIAERVVTWKPSLSVKEYRGLSVRMKAEIDKVLTIKPGAPDVEIVVPKSK